MEHKTFSAKAEVKQGDEEGTVIVRFATLGVIDSDEDVTEPGAFGEQTVRMHGHGHNTRDLMIGKGIIREDGDAAICEHRVNLAMMAGREAYESLKFDAENGEPLQEWSYTFDVLDSGNGEFEGRQVRFLRKLKVHSVDPVFLGAGIDTATVAVKDLGDGSKLAFVGAHRPAMADEGAAWSAPTLGDFTSEAWGDLSADERRRIAQHYTGSRSSIPPDTFGDLFGPHHQAAKTGVGPVVWRAVSSGRMMQMGAAITASPAFRRHLATHYRQFGKTPPWEEERGLPFDERFEEVEDALCDVLGFVGGAEKLVASLREQGEQLTERKRAYLDGLLADVTGVHIRLEALLKEPEAARPLTGTAIRLRLSELEQAQRQLVTLTT